MFYAFQEGKRWNSSVAEYHSIPKINCGSFRGRLEEKWGSFRGRFGIILGAVQDSHGTVKLRR